MISRTPHNTRQRTPLCAALRVVVIVAALSGLACVRCQDLQVSPPSNTTVSLSVYTEMPQTVQSWSLVNPSTLFMTVTGVALLPPLYAAIALQAPALPFAPPARVFVLINSSQLQPSTLNASVLLTYTVNGQQRQQTLNASIACLQALRVNHSFGTNASLSTGQAVTTAIKLRSQPYSALNLSLAYNVEYGDFLGSTPSGTPWRGGGPLLSASPAWLLFTPLNWNQTQTFTVASVATSLIWGNRWSVLSFGFATSDPTLLPLAAAFPDSNITILESNVAAVVFSQSAFALLKNASDVLITVQLQCQPRALVEVTLTQNAWVGLAPSSLVFAPDSWNVPLTVRLHLFTDHTIGVEHISLAFPALQSTDAEFASVAPAPLSLTLSDPDPSFAAFGPQFGPAGTNLTLTWPAPLTFVPLDASTPVAVVQCLFGSGQFACNSSGTGFCPVSTPAVIVGERQVQCQVPPCTYDAVESRACYNPAAVSVLINSLEAKLSANSSATIARSCQGSSSACMVGPSVVYSGTAPIASQCLSASCAVFPSTFSYVPLPVITTVSPSSVELAASTSVTVVLTVIGAGAFSSPTALCVFGGVPSPAFAVFDANLSTSTYPYSASLRCLSPVRTDLLGSSSPTPLSFAVTLTGQASDLSTTAVTLSGVDSVATKASSDLTTFLVCCLVAFACLVALLFQHYCCRDCRAVHHRLTGEGRRRGERGPQKLIDLLEPRVRLKQRLVEEDERRRKEEEREERRRIDERVRSLKANRKAASDERERGEQSAAASQQQPQPAAEGAEKNARSAAAVKQGSGGSMAGFLLFVLKSAGRGPEDPLNASNGVPAEPVARRPRRESSSRAPRQHKVRRAPPSGAAAHADAVPPLR